MMRVVKLQTVEEEVEEHENNVDDSEVNYDDIDYEPLNIIDGEPVSPSSVQPFDNFENDIIESLLSLSINKDEEIPTPLPSATEDDGSGLAFEDHFDSESIDSLLSLSFDDEAALHPPAAADTIDFLLSSPIENEESACSPPSDGDDKGTEREGSSLIFENNLEKKMMMMKLNDPVSIQREKLLEFGSRFIPLQCSVCDDTSSSDEEDKDDDEEDEDGEDEEDDGQRFTTSNFERYIIESMMSLYVNNQEQFPLPPSTEEDSIKNRIEELKDDEQPSPPETSNEGQKGEEKGSLSKEQVNKVHDTVSLQRDQLLNYDSQFLTTECIPCDENPSVEGENDEHEFTPDDLEDLLKVMSEGMSEEEYEQFLDTVLMTEDEEQLLPGILPGLETMQTTSPTIPLGNEGDKASLLGLLPPLCYPCTDEDGKPNVPLIRKTIIATKSSHTTNSSSNDALNDESSLADNDAKEKI